MICILGISHKDAEQAERWVEFVAGMSRRERPGQPRIVLAFTKLAARHIPQIQRAGHRAGGNANAIASAIALDDENETGYPVSASHLFLRSLEYCERVHPGEPVLWLEPDTLPMRPNWREDIASEYAACGSPFMGHIEREHGLTHLAGVAVYPHDWRIKAPLISAVLTAPDIFWGKGLGQAFDTWAAPEIVPQSATARGIQQIWRPPLPITAKWLRQNVRQDAALFHQVKDKSGFKAVKEGLKL